MAILREAFEKWWGSRAPDEQKAVAWAAWRAGSDAARLASARICYRKAAFMADEIDRAHVFECGRLIDDLGEGE